ncbi:hypothetical protein [Roseburia intestinalis]
MAIDYGQDVKGNPAGDEGHRFAVWEMRLLLNFSGDGMAALVESKEKV